MVAAYRHQEVVGPGAAPRRRPRARSQRAGHGPLCDGRRLCEQQLDLPADRCPDQGRAADASADDDRIACALVRPPVLSLSSDEDADQFDVRRPEKLVDRQDSRVSAESRRPSGCARRGRRWRGRRRRADGDSGALERGDLRGGLGSAARGAGGGSNSTASSRFISAASSGTARQVARASAVMAFRPGRRARGGRSAP